MKRLRGGFIKWFSEQFPSELLTALNTLIDTGGCCDMGYQFWTGDVQYYEWWRERVIPIVHSATHD